MHEEAISEFSSFKALQYTFLEHLDSLILESFNSLSFLVTSPSINVIILPFGSLFIFASFIALLIMIFKLSVFLTTKHVSLKVIFFNVRVFIIIHEFIFVFEWLIKIMLSMLLLVIPTSFIFIIVVSFVQA